MHLHRMLLEFVVKLKVVACLKLPVVRGQEVLSWLFGIIRTRF